jgi:hypothetical protein
MPEASHTAALCFPNARNKEAAQEPDGECDTTVPQTPHTIQRPTLCVYILKLM